MFALGIELLMRRAILTRWDNREEPEWPPHPDRVFMALVAAWGESGEDVDEKAALLWLESLELPAMRVSVDASKRTAFTSYVPVNDECSPIGKKGKAETPLGSLPFGRARNGRTFPTIVPEDPTFHLVWRGVNLAKEHHPALDRLCGQVTYLGHSATPIRIWVESQSVEPNLIPTNGNAQFQFRVFGPGRLENLEIRYNRQAVDDYSRLTQEVEHLKMVSKASKGKEKKELQIQLGTTRAKLEELFGGNPPQTLRPLPSLWQGYSPPALLVDEKLVDGPFDPGLIVLRQVDGRRFSLESCGLIANAIRNTLMSRYGENPPEWLSGHAADGSPSTSRRPTYLPLGFVGREHADGHLLGVAVAVPRDFPENHIHTLYELLGRHDGTNPHDIEKDVPFLSLSFRDPVSKHGVGKLDLVLDETNERNPRANLKPSTWVKPACCWSTVTPIILPQFPRRKLTPEQVISKACTDAGYPTPVAIRAGHAPFLEGVPHARTFRVNLHGDRPQRPWMHAEIQFAQCVRGPVVIGTGRYTGFGVCRPILQEKTP